MENISERFSRLSLVERELIKELIKDKINGTSEAAIIFQHHREKALYLNILYMLGIMELNRVEIAALTVLLTAKVESTYKLKKSKFLLISLIN